MPLLTPMKTMASQPPGVKRGTEAKKPSPAARIARKPTEASMAKALTCSAGYVRRYGRYSTLQTAPHKALANTASSPTHPRAPPPWITFSPRASPTPAIVNSTPRILGTVSRSWPSAAASTRVSRGKVAKMSAARPDGTNRRP